MNTGVRGPQYRQLAGAGSGFFTRRKALRLTNGSGCGASRGNSEYALGSTDAMTNLPLDVLPRHPQARERKAVRTRQWGFNVQRTDMPGKQEIGEDAHARTHSGLAVERLAV